MYNNVSKSSLKQLQWTLNVYYYYYYYCKKTNNIALKYNNKVKGKEKGKKDTPQSVQKKNSLKIP